MTDHLSPLIVTALVDGELSADRFAVASDHLASCSWCTTQALHQSLLKTATTRAGQRYTPPKDLQRRLTELASLAGSTSPEAMPAGATVVASRQKGLYRELGWAATAALLFVCISLLFLQHTTGKSEIASIEGAALQNEAFDQHIATLAGNAPPQVLSTDRHTVKPWFQGKLPFSFNLPQNLPADTTLEGANLAYLHDRPVAQLLYSIGKHHVSVFVTQRSEKTTATQSSAEHSGFHVVNFSTDELAFVAVSDVDPIRLAELENLLRKSQTQTHL